VLQNILNANYEKFIDDFTITIYIADQIFCCGSGDFGKNGGERRGLEPSKGADLSVLSRRSSRDTAPLISGLF
jgi:hypothetical protein